MRGHGARPREQFRQSDQPAAAKQASPVAWRPRAAAASLAHQAFGSASWCSQNQTHDDGRPNASPRLHPSPQRPKQSHRGRRQRHGLRYEPGASPNASSADWPPGATRSRRTRAFPHLASPPRRPAGLPLYISTTVPGLPFSRTLRNGTSNAGSRTHHLTTCHVQLSAMGRSKHPIPSFKEPL